jgi:hypothetical protein
MKNVHHGSRVKLAIALARRRRRHLHLHLQWPFDPVSSPFYLHYATKHNVTSN